MNNPSSTEPAGNAVIIVEDDEIVLKTLSLQLIDRGWDIFTTHKEATALDLCRSHPHAVVLIGAGMPDLDGVTLARKLKESEPDRIVIAMTGYPRLNQLLEGLYHETFDYLVKPFRIEQLDMVIDRARREINLRQENTALKLEVAQLRGSLAEALQPKTPAPAPEESDSLTLDPRRPALERDPNAIASYERQIRSSTAAQGPPPQAPQAGQPMPEEEAVPPTTPGLESPGGD